MAMKHTFIFIAAVSILPISRGSETLPASIQQIVDQRNSAIEKIDIKYVNELEKLKIHFTKKGDLNTANSIVKLIDEAKKQSRDINKLYIGKWVYTPDIPNDRRIMDREFIETHLIDENGAHHPIIIKNNLLRVSWGGSNNVFEEIYIDTKNPNTMTGVNQNGTRFTYVRKK